MSKGRCRHGEFELEEGCPQCIGERLGTASVSSGIEPTGVMKIAPDKDKVVLNLFEKVKKIAKFASERTIKDQEDVRIGTNDLGAIATMKKAVKKERQRFIGPLNAEVEEINAFFKQLSEPIAEADSITRKLILRYNAEVEQKRAEAERIENERLALAKAEQELTGEHTQDLTPVDKPDATPDRTRAEIGMSSKMTVWKWEVEDLSLVPSDYLMVDSTKIGKVVRASKGTISIPGINIYAEGTLRVTTQ